MITRLGVIAVVTAMVAAAQTAPAPAQPTNPLAAAAAASAAAPPATNPAGLGGVKTLFIEPMPHELNQHIGAEIIRQLGSRFQLVNSREQADAVMSGTGQLRGGKTGVVTAKVLGVQSNASGSVMITDKTGSQVLWAGAAAGRSILGGVVRKGGPRKVAERLVRDLKKAIR